MSEIRSKIVPDLRFPGFVDGNDWVEATLGSAARFINGRAYKQEEMLEKGKYLLLRVGNFFTNNQWYYSDLELEPDKYCEDGDLLYAWSASFGPRIWRGEKTIYHYHIWKVEPNKTIDKQFLYILLDYETERMKSQSANGFALLHITKGTIEGWNCNFPVSIKEQQKIANCLSTLDELITAQSQKLEAFKTHKKGLMQQLFPAEGKTVPKLRFAEFRNSGEWENRTLGSIAENLSNKRIPITSNVREKGNIPYYGASGVIDFVKDFIFDDNLLCISEDGANLMDRVYPIAFSISGKTWVNNHAHVLKFKNSSTQVLVENYLNSINLEDFLTGMAQPKLNRAKLDSIPFPLPTTKEEQQKIADCLSSLDELITAQTEKIATLKMHKKGLMQGLFPSLETEN